MMSEEVYPRNPRAAICVRYKKTGHCPKFNPGGSRRCAFDHPPKHEINLPDSVRAEINKDMFDDEEEMARPRRHVVAAATPSTGARTAAGKELVSDFMWRLRKHLRELHSNLKEMFLKGNQGKGGLVDSMHFKRMLETAGFDDVPKRQWDSLFEFTGLDANGRLDFADLDRLYQDCRMENVQGVGRHNNHDLFAFMKALDLHLNAGRSNLKALYQSCSPNRHGRVSIRNFQNTLDDEGFEAAPDQPLTRPPADP